MSKYFEVYVLGIVHASVCTDLTRRAATERLNREHPSGITSRWRPSKEPAFLGGEPNPSPCERDPSRTHYLFSC